MTWQILKKVLKSKWPVTHIRNMNAFTEETAEVTLDTWWAKRRRLQYLWRGCNESEGPEHFDSDQGTAGSPGSTQEKAISVNRSQFPQNLSTSYYFFSWMPQATVSIQHGNLSSVPKKRERALDSQRESTLHQEEGHTLCGAYYNFVLNILYHKYL